jgi:hypothetical protein
VCYFLSIASPLTLSEIRSMLPAGLTADLAPSVERTLMIRLHPSAKTVAHLLVGACSCDLVRPRLKNSLEDEREHRDRYRRRQLSRSDMIRQLERHRRGPLPRPEHPGGWGTALAGFVAEHARNAGPTLYRLEFAPPDRSVPGSVDIEPVRRSVEEVRAAAGQWLTEDQPVLVI